jgi:uridine kinase
MQARAKFLEDLASALPAPDGAPVRIGIDGPDGAGKTMLRRELALILVGRGRSVIQASMDDFHNPRETRYRQGRFSPQGYWDDAFDRAAFIRKVLDPLGPGGSREVCLRHHDLVADEPFKDPRRAVVDDNVTLLVDGNFLQHPDLAPYWDTVIYLDVPFSVRLPRMVARDGMSPDPQDPMNERYYGGQLIYRGEVSPLNRADIVVDNADLKRPRLLRMQRA